MTQNEIDQKLWNRCDVLSDQADDYLRCVVLVVQECLDDLLLLSFFLFTNRDKYDWSPAKMRVHRTNTAKAEP